MKICLKCGLEKCETEYYRWRAVCIECCKTYVKNKRINKTSTFWVRKSKGLCGMCGKVPEGDLKHRASGTIKTMCRSCLRENADKIEGHRKLRLSKGLCSRCGKNPHKPERKHCEECTKKLSKQMKERSLRRFFDRRAHTGNGLCYSVNSAKMLWSLWKEQRGCCALTGIRLNRENAELDHIIPKSKGGGNERSNLRWTIRDVNQAKRALSDIEFLFLCQSVVNWATLKDKNELSRTS